MRRATGRFRHEHDHRPISIHALHEESDRGEMARRGMTQISIHALHEESDLILWAIGLTVIFQSTLSMRRATRPATHPATRRTISIHALHEESDNLRRQSVADAWGRFQSTLSMRRATSSALTLSSTGLISIHALHEESDFLCVLFYYHAVVFQSTLSMRRATFSGR